MKEVIIESKLYVFDTLEDTPKDIQSLMQLEFYERACGIDHSTGLSILVL